MNTSTVALGWMIVVGALLGIATYEVFFRLALPQRQGGLASQQEVAPRKRQGDSPLNAASSKAKAGAHAGVLLGLLSQVLERFAPLSRHDSEAYQDRLRRAGVRVAPETWRSARVVIAVAGGFAAALASLLFAPAVSLMHVVMVGIGGCVGWLIPALVLAHKEKERKRTIVASLPDAMELLGIAIAAGSPVEQCFREVSESMAGPLAEEFASVDREVNLVGHGRETALKNMAERCCSQEVSAFVAQLTQAISQGSSIAEGLARQAALARETAQADMLERIRKMPTKLDIVLSLCFLPPTVALVIIPTVVKLLHFLNDTMS